MVADNAGKFVHFLPHPAGLALQSLLFLAEFGLQLALENTAEVASLQDKVQDVQQQLLRLCMDLGSVPDDIQHDINRITETLLKVSVVLDDLRRPASGWRKCTSCLRVVLCALCDAQKLQGVAADLNTVLNQISSTLNRILARRIGRPAEAAPELPAHLDKGMDGRVTKVMEFLRTSTNQSVRVVGLHGEGGIGKTTLMHAVHNQLKRDPVSQQAHKIGYVEVGMTPRSTTDQLQKSLFVELQKSLYEQLSGGDKLSFSSTAQGRSELKDLLAKLQKPVCIFLDDVWQSEHLQDLLPGELFKVLSRGSYMLISSRSRDVVKQLGKMCFKSTEEEVQGYLDYQLELLEEDDAMDLFLKNASRAQETSPLSKEDALVKAVVPLCGGLPLALAVYGAFFKDESKRELNAWQRVYKRMRETGDPSGSVFNKLKLSVEFQKKELQDAFLDIALFFNRNHHFDLDAVKYALKEEDYLEILVDQSLVRVEGDSGYGEVVVHDVLVLVARQMAEERSIAASLPKFEHDDPLPDQLQVRYFDVKAWPRSINYPSPSQMEGCRYLILDGLELDFFLTTIAKHCRSIRLLRLGQDFLDELHFTEHVFPWMANLKELTVLFSSGCTTSFHIASTPKICFQLRSFISNGMFPKSFLQSSSTSLQRILLYCGSLAQLPPEIGRLSALTRLELRGCWSLAQLPPEIGRLSALTRLELDGCWSLAQLPPEIGRLSAMTGLVLDGCGSLAQLPPEIGRLSAMTGLVLGGCGSLAQLPPEIGRLSALYPRRSGGCPP